MVKADLALLPVLIIGHDVWLKVDLFEFLKQYWLTCIVRRTLSPSDAQFITHKAQRNRKSSCAGTTNGDALLRSDLLVPSARG